MPKCSTQWQQPNLNPRIRLFRPLSYRNISESYLVCGVLL